MLQRIWQLMCALELTISIIVHITYAGTVIAWALVCDFIKFFRVFTSTPEKLPPSALPRKVSKFTEASLSTFTADVPPASGENLNYNADDFEKAGNLYQNLAPIVLVHGIFGFGHGKLGGLSYFGGAELRDDRVLVPDLGSLSSLHDRACELFYYLKGGTVDYGKEHSQHFGHNRFGRVYNIGHYPEWDENHPIHFVGHSSGVQVVRLLQTLLAEKYFPGFENSNADWVASLTSISGAMNGSTRVYIDGLSPSDGLSLRPCTLLQVLYLVIIFTEWFDITPLKRYYSWGFDHFNLSWHKVGLVGLWDLLMKRIGPLHSGDWILPDLSLQASMELNKRLKTYPNTYYFSYATKKTRRVMGRTLPITAGIHPVFLIRSFQMSQWRLPQTCVAPYEGYRDEDWHDNDGCLNTISMLYPRVPTKHMHCPLKLKGRQRFEPGIWYYTLFEADHITFILNPARAGIHFDILYDSIFTRCRKHLHKSTARLLCECDQVCICAKAIFS